MPWVAPIIGYVDNLGYLRCSECAEERHRDIAVSGEQRFGADDVCECCGWRFKHITSKNYIQVAFDAQAPDFKRPVIATPTAPIAESFIKSPRGKRTHYWPANEAARRNAGYGFG